MGLLRKLATCLFCLTLPSAAYAFDPCTKSNTIISVHEGTLTIQWVGPIKNNMDSFIASAFYHYKDRVSAVTLKLSSCGGASETANRTVKVLRRIKRTHDLTTVVRHGDHCASACVDVFLEGSRRIAGLASSWLFHEPIDRQAREQNGLAITDAEYTERMLAQYVAVGVSRRWLERMRKEIKGANWWQTGRDLWVDQSGIITEVMGNSMPRDTSERPVETTCVLCSDPRVSYGQRPAPEYLPDPMDMQGIPTGR